MGRKKNRPMCTKYDYMYDSDEWTRVEDEINVPIALSAFRDKTRLDGTYTKLDLDGKKLGWKTNAGEKTARLKLVS